MLECEKILKIVHNCRCLSDLMFHQYHLHLINIFDTQAASALAYKKQMGFWPKYVDGLSNCLIKRLKLDPNKDVYVSRVFEPMQDDQETAVWASRPPADCVIDALIKNVAHLLDLRRVILNELQIDLVSAIEVYLRVYKNAETVADRPCNSHCLPKEFHKFDTKYQQNNFKKVYGNDPGQFDKEIGFIENWQLMTDPLVRLSQDGMWHKGDGTVDTTVVANTDIKAVRIAKGKARNWKRPSNSTSLQSGPVPPYRCSYE